MVAAKSASTIQATKETEATMMFTTRVYYWVKPIAMHSTMESILKKLMT